MFCMEEPESTASVMRNWSTALKLHRNEEELVPSAWNHYITDRHSVCVYTQTALPKQNKSTLFEAQYVADPLCFLRLHNLSESSLLSLCLLFSLSRAATGMNLKPAPSISRSDLWVIIQAARAAHCSFEQQTLNNESGFPRIDCWVHDAHATKQ